MKVHTTILKILSPYRYRYIYIALFVVAILLVIENMWYVIAFIPIFWFVFHHHRDLFYPIIVVVVLYMMSRYYIDFQTINYIDAQPVLKVTNVSYKEDYYNITARKGLISVRIYLTDGEAIKVGSYYMFNGEWDTPTSQTIPSGFDYKNYLLSKRIKYILYAESSEFIDHGFSILQVRQLVYDYIERTMPISKDYIKTFILADKSDIDQSVISGVNFMGISHMFAVSGYHIGLLVLAISYAGKKAHLPEHLVQYGILFLLFLYMIVTGFTPSVVRASLLYILLYFNREIGNLFSVYDVLSIIFLVLLLINPYIYHNSGFVLSFYITFVLLLSQPILKGKTSIVSISIVSVIAFTMSLPIVLNMNYQINLLTLVFNVVMIYLMSFVVLPLSYLTFLFPLLDPMSGTIFSWFDQLIVVFSDIDVLIVDGYFSHPIWNVLFIAIAFYILMQVEMKRVPYKTIIVGLIVFFVANNVSLLRMSQRMVLVDVKGDGIVFIDKQDQCNIVIDTGEVDRYNGLVGYLKSQHIKRIDYLIISHFHSDHYGEAEDIMENFTVKHLVTNQVVQDYENQPITCGNIELFIYPLSYESANENNNSIILSVIMANKHFLLTGDSEIKREEELMVFPLLYVDYLKLGHHGSITSTTEAFLDYVQPKQALITVHRDNKNDHPSDIILDRLEQRNIPIYRTDMMGTIEFIYINGKEQKKYYRP